jgi:PRTRC genetic system protein B
MAHSTVFEATQGGLALSNAILLYRTKGIRYGEQASFASMHDVEQLDGKPLIGAGTPLTRAHLRQWTEALGKAAAPEILPANVLVAHPDMLAWWVPEHSRTAYFAISRPPEGLKALAERTSVRVPYPAHVLVTTRRTLGVYALAKNERPTAETALLCSPILNVFANGTLCWGNIPKPKTINVAAIPEYEGAVFDSWSTHPTPGQEHSLKGKGGLVRLWDGLAAGKAKRFPAHRLQPFNRGQQHPKEAAPITLGQIIGGKRA